MNILVFSGGKYSSLDGSAVRFKNLVVNRNAKANVVWIDGSSQKKYKTENLDAKIPKNVKLAPGIEPKRNPASELVARERHFLHYAKQYADWADVAVFYSPWGCALARRELKKRGVPLVFDYIDLIHKFRSNPIERAASRLAVISALRNSDLVVATAFNLLEDARRFNKRVALVANGADVEKISRIRPLPLKQGKVKKPAVGFVGGFGEWVDFDAVLGAAKEMRGVHFYFIGDGVQRKKLEDAAGKMKNVFVSPQFVPQPHSFEWMASMDVCLIPFAKNELTDAVCPIKLFEYWALRKPVVSSRISEVERIAGNALLYASTPREYERAIERAVGDSKLRSDLSKKGFAKAKEFDWAGLSERFLKALESVSKSRRSK
ncbi:glycosyltransferase [Candidatus Micrarchaeota archaeon]|nr:glycosyltransferase [Candidatus Micrarchaeota archaeon]